MKGFLSNSPSSVTALIYPGTSHTAQGLETCLTQASLPFKKDYRSFLSSFKGLLAHLSCTHTHKILFLCIIFSDITGEMVEPPSELSDSFWKIPMEILNEFFFFEVRNSDPKSLLKIFYVLE